MESQEPKHTSDGVALDLKKKGKHFQTSHQLFTLQACLSYSLLLNVIYELIRLSALLLDLIARLGCVFFFFFLLAKEKTEIRTGNTLVLLSVTWNKLEIWSQAAISRLPFKGMRDALFVVVYATEWGEAVEDEDASDPVFERAAVVDSIV